MNNKIYSIIILCFVVGSAFGQNKKERERSSNPSFKTLEQRTELKPFDSKAVRQIVDDYPKYINLNFQDLESKEFKIIRQSENGIIKAFEGRTKENGQQGSDWNEKINKWNSEASKFLGINAETNSYYTQKQWTDELGMTHVKQHQFHNGIRVYNAETILHANASNQIVSQNGNYVRSKELPTTKSDVLPFEAVQENIKSNLKNYRTDIKNLNGINLKLNIKQWDDELVYYKKDDKHILAYYVKVYPNLGEHFEYIIDASNGEVLKKYSTICSIHNHNHSHEKGKCNHDHENCSEVIIETELIKHEEALVDGPVAASGMDLLGVNRNFSVYDFNNAFYMIDASRTMFNSFQSQMPDDPVGAIWTIDMMNTSPVNGGEFAHVASTSNNWAQSPVGVSAHFNAGRAYDYFKNIHGRESISGNGQNIISFVNVGDEDGSSLGNAFWNGVGIYYGNGDNMFLELGRGLDVAGHEMTHGVVQATADLEYYGESGAINESMADVFGAMIDRDDWQIGEDVMRFGGQLRSMSDPHNGAAAGDFGNGFQPSHYSERYTGSQDNAGVHINSGIPNHAYYLFANQVGKDVAEKVYYRALTTYLTRSSQFNDLRYAVANAAEDLYGTPTANQARQAFDQVGVAPDGPGNYEEDYTQNPGDDLLMFTDPELSNSFIINLTQSSTVFNPLSETDILSKPSITDDGSIVVFVGTDNHIHWIDINWNANPPTKNEQIISSNPEWANIIISKDGSRLAGQVLLVSPENDPQNRSIWVRDLALGASQFFELYNPTYTEGINTGDVLYADAMEFDITGNIVMFDALNRIEGNTGKIEFWDIGFLEVWNSTSDTWALGRVDKLFGSLPEDLSVGNPTYSKNSPYIIAFDYIEANLNQMLGVNIETGEVGEIFESTDLMYPNYSRNDEVMVYDLNIFDPTEIGILSLESDKINLVPNSDNFLFTDPTPSKWPVWFSNGDRNLSNTEDIVEDNSALIISPNPAFDHIKISLDSDLFIGNVQLEITDLSGKMLFNKSLNAAELNNYNYNTSHLDAGVYLLNIRSENNLITRKFVKQ